jgi:hypothetical protein
MKKLNKGALFIGAVGMVLSALPAVPTYATRGIEVSLPAYVWPNDQFLTDLISPTTTPTPPSIIILNKSGDVSDLDANSDALRARENAYSENVKTIGYVNTRVWQSGVGMVLRPEQDIKDEIDAWLVRSNEEVHYDGIFFDQTPRECGTTADPMLYRDFYRGLREYVQNTIPNIQEVVVDNPGTAVADCYLASGHDTADIFVTFEGTRDVYFQTPSSGNGYVGYTGGNVFNSSGYRPGTEWDSWRFWHLVYDTDGSEVEGVMDAAYNRYAGHIDVTDDHLTGVYLNPWDAKPSYLNDAIDYAASLPL